MQIGPRLPSLGGSLGKAIGSVTEPIKHAVTSPLGLSVAGLALGGPLGIASHIPGLSSITSSLGGLFGGGAAAGGVGGIADASQALGDSSGVLARLGLSPKDLIGLAGGALGGIQDQRNQDATRGQQQDEFTKQLALQQQQFGLQQQQYGDTHARQQATSAGLSPVIQRLLGQWGGNGLGDLMGGQPHAPFSPEQGAAFQGAPGGMLAKMHAAGVAGQAPPPQQPQVMRQPAPVPMRPNPEDQQAPVMSRLGYPRPMMMQRAA